MLRLLAWLVGSSIGRYVAIGGILALFTGIIALRFFMKGREHEQLKQAMQSLDHLRKRIKVDDTIAKLPAGARRERLSRWMRDGAG